MTCENYTECDCKQKILTNETIGYSWKVLWLEGGGAGSWNIELKKSMEACAEEILIMKNVTVREIKIVQRKWKDRMKID